MNQYAAENVFLSIRPLVKNIEVDFSAIAPSNNFADCLLRSSISENAIKKSCISINLSVAFSLMARNITR